jgi:superfamily I DNA/RNA helicase
MLIGELVPEALSYLRNNPTCPELSTFEHVIVDEYQDLNRSDQLLIDLLTSGNGVISGVRISLSIAFVTRILGELRSSVEPIALLAMRISTSAAVVLRGLSR